MYLSWRQHGTADDGLLLAKHFAGLLPVLRVLMNVSAEVLRAGGPSGSRTNPLWRVLSFSLVVFGRIAGACDVDGAPSGKDVWIVTGLLSSVLSEEQSILSSCLICLASLVDKIPRLAADVQVQIMEVCLNVFRGNRRALSGAALQTLVFLLRQMCRILPNARRTIAAACLANSAVDPKLLVPVLETCSSSAVRASFEHAVSRGFQVSPQAAWDVLLGLDYADGYFGGPSCPAPLLSAVLRHIALGDSAAAMVVGRMAHQNAALRRRLKSEFRLLDIIFGVLLQHSSSFSAALLQEHGLQQLLLCLSSCLGDDGDFLAVIRLRGLRILASVVSGWQDPSRIAVRIASLKCIVQCSCVRDEVSQIDEAELSAQMSLSWLVKLHADVSSPSSPLPASSPSSASLSTGRSSEVLLNGSRGPDEDRATTDDVMRDLVCKALSNLATYPCLIGSVVESFDVAAVLSLMDRRDLPADSLFGLATMLANIVDHFHTFVHPSAAAAAAGPSRSLQEGEAAATGRWGLSGHPLPSSPTSSGLALPRQSSASPKPHRQQPHQREKTSEMQIGPMSFVQKSCRLIYAYIRRRLCSSKAPHPPALLCQFLRCLTSCLRCGVGAPWSELEDLLSGLIRGDISLARSSATDRSISDVESASAAISPWDPPGSAFPADTRRAVDGPAVDVLDLLLMYFSQAISSAVWMPSSALVEFLFERWHIHAGIGILLRFALEMSQEDSTTRACLAGTLQRSAVLRRLVDRLQEGNSTTSGAGRGFAPSYDVVGCLLRFLQFATLPATDSTCHASRLLFDCGAVPILAGLCKSRSLSTAVSAAMILANMARTAEICVSIVECDGTRQLERLYRALDTSGQPHSIHSPRLEMESSGEDEAMDARQRLESLNSVGTMLDHDLIPGDAPAGPAPLAPPPAAAAADSHPSSPFLLSRPAHPSLLPASPAAERVRIMCLQTLANCSAVGECAQIMITDGLLHRLLAEVGDSSVVVFLKFRIMANLLAATAAAAAAVSDYDPRDQHPRDQHPLQRDEISAVISYLPRPVHQGSLVQRELLSSAGHGPGTPPSPAAAASPATASAQLFASSLRSPSGDGLRPSFSPSQSFSPPVVLSPASSSPFQQFDSGREGAENSGWSLRRKSMVQGVDVASFLRFSEMQWMAATEACRCLAYVCHHPVSRLHLVTMSVPWILMPVLSEHMNFLFHVRTSSVTRARTPSWLLRISKCILRYVACAIANASCNDAIEQQLIESNCLSIWSRFLRIAPREDLRYALQCLSNLSATQSCVLYFMQHGIVNAVLKACGSLSQSVEALAIIANLCMVVETATLVEKEGGLRLLLEIFSQSVDSSAPGGETDAASGTDKRQAVAPEIRRQAIRALANVCAVGSKDTVLQLLLHPDFFRVVLHRNERDAVVHLYCLGAVVNLSNRRDDDMTVLSFQAGCLERVVDVGLRALQTKDISSLRLSASALKNYAEIRHVQFRILSDATAVGLLTSVIFQTEDDPPSHRCAAAALASLAANGPSLVMELLTRVGVDPTALFSLNTGELKSGKASSGFSLKRMFMSSEKKAVRDLSSVSSVRASDTACEIQ